MKKITLSDLQESVQDNSAFGTLNDYFAICNTFFQVIQKEKPTRIVSPSQSNYIFINMPRPMDIKLPVL